MQESKKQTNYTEDEKLVLNYFFTNLDKEIFATKNFHPEVWALMQARYSRSKAGLREGFLKLLKEDANNFQELLDFIKENKSGARMDHAVDKAIKFMDKWVLGYGHSSVAEGAVIGLGLEGASILATKAIEDNRISSYIEKSTRYVSFGRDSFFIPKKLKNSEYGKEIEEFIDELFQGYMDLHEPVLEYIKNVSPLQEGMKEKAWERSCEARRFDAIRYILPACTKTSLGWTVNARQLAHAISKLLSHPLKEMQEIGRNVKEEAKKVLPSLLKYAEENPYFKETEIEMHELGNDYWNPKKKNEKGKEEKAVELVESLDEEKVDSILITSILYRYGNSKYSEIKEIVKRMAREEKEKIYDKYISGKGEFDSLLREFEHVYITFDVLIDYGAFRDVQRHRMQTQTNPLLTAGYGYDIPDDIRNAGSEVLEKYTSLMEKAAALYNKIEDKYNAQYILPLAFKKRVLITMNLREAYTFIKLRSTPQGHISYRKIAKEMFDLLKEKYPLTTKYFTCDLSEDELGRMKQETKFEEKIEKGML